MKVGDKVVIKSEDLPNNLFINDLMVKFCGKVVTIKAVNPKMSIVPELYGETTYSIEELPQYYWSENCFEPYSIPGTQLPDLKGKKITCLTWDDNKSKN